ncbi:MAG: Crp/Fnr family transcriptional regulator, partial [Gammaproteobacteria bacterium]|nr:Crp/Fnr family transcriptional regulator [Gammaproteobacteria bacterium]
VVKGTIKLSRLSIDGDEKVIELVTPGKTFAEALMFGDQPNYPVRATAIGTSAVFAFSNKTFLKILHSSPVTCFRLLGEMSVRLHRMVKEIDDLTLQSASSRVAGYLYNCAHTHGDDLRSFSLNTPKGVLASMLSIKPETFSRILQAFIGEGLIKVEGKHIEVINDLGLRRHAKFASDCGFNLEPSSGRDQSSAKHL